MGFFSSCTLCFLQPLCFNVNAMKERYIYTPLLNTNSNWLGSAALLIRRRSFFLYICSFMWFTWEIGFNMIARLHPHISPCCTVFVQCFRVYIKNSGIGDESWIFFLNKKLFDQLSGGNCSVTHVLISDYSASSAKESLIYSYGRSFNGFAAKLTKDEAESISGDAIIFKAANMRIYIYIYI